MYRKTEEDKRKNWAKAGGEKFKSLCVLCVCVCVNGKSKAKSFSTKGARKNRWGE